MITAPGQTIPRLAPRPALPRDTAPRPTGGDFAWREDWRGTRLAPNWLMVRDPERRWWRVDGGALVLDARRVRILSGADGSILST